MKLPFKKLIFFFLLQTFLFSQSAKIEVSAYKGSNDSNLKIYEYLPVKKIKSNYLVIYLHGCTESARKARNVGFEQMTNRFKFTLAYIETNKKNNSYKCFNWFLTKETARGRGEVYTIASMIQWYQKKTHIGPQKTFIVGFSAGAFMAVAVGAAYPELVSVVGSIAGGPYQCADNFFNINKCTNYGMVEPVSYWVDQVLKYGAKNYQGSWPRLFSYHGHEDKAVTFMLQKELMKQWAGLHELKKGLRSVFKPQPTITKLIWPNKKHRALLAFYSDESNGHRIPIDSSSNCGSKGKYRTQSKFCFAEEFLKFAIEAN